MRRQFRLMPHRRLVGDLPTPALLLDAAALERNLAGMAAKTRALGVALRPHVKTHKCPEIGRMQLAHGARGITVATLAEAVTFADAGFDDITWAFPLVLARLEEVTALARRITFRVVVESAPALEALDAAGRRAGLAVHAWLEVDSGHHRSGVDPAAPASLELARRLAGEPGVVFDGLLTHAGHSYRARTREERAAVAERERALMAAFATRLEQAGVHVPAVSVGSTPALSAVERLDGVSEVRPGNYAFYDFMQLAAGVCVAADCAVTVLASVVSHQTGAGHVVVDAGALALSKDTGPADPALARGFGPVLRGLAGHELEPSLEVQGMSQEHGMVGGARAEEVAGRLPVGGKVRILPNHSCLTVAMFDEYQVVRGEEVVDRWPIRRAR
jgi:D-serine deaminase-like pyridoxal phosphate-dependent protein